jgi:hypothetical protein
MNFVALSTRDLVMKVSGRREYPDKRRTDKGSQDKGS